MSTSGRGTLLFRRAALAVIAALAGFQLVGLTLALVGASWPRVTDFGLIGPGLGSYSDLLRLRAAGGLPVDSVWGPGIEAGLDSGDVITHIDGVLVTQHPRVWYGGRFTIRPDTTLRLTVLRNGETLEIPLVTRRLERPWRWPVNPDDPDGPSMTYQVWHWWQWGPDLLLSFLMFAVGLALGVLRPANPSAWTFALVFLGISLATSMGSGTPLLHIWPPWLALFWCIGQQAGGGYALPLSLVGLCSFPVPTRVSRRVWPWRWVLATAMGLPALCIMVMLAIAHTGRWPLASLEPVSRVVERVHQASLALGFGVMGVLLAAHQFERGPAGRARLRTLWYGAMGAVVGGLWSVLIPETFWFWLMRPFGSAGVWMARFLDDIAPALLVCLTPLSFAYAILARRLFGIRLVIRRGIQHLLLSRAVLAVEAVVLFLVIEHAIRGGGTILGVRRPLIAGVLAVLVVVELAIINRPLMRAIDRRFFRDRYDARRVMLGLGQELALLRGQEEILPRVGQTIVAALHPSRVGLFLTPLGGRELVRVWSSDPDPPPGDREAAARAEREAAELGVRLSAGDRAWHAVEPGATTEADAIEGPTGAARMDDPGPPPLAPYELCIPLQQPQRIAGCIALAAKRSEEPYTSEDRELLVTVAHQASLALENADLLAVARREAQLAREVEIARDVQRNLFPRELPRVPGWEVAAVCRPARTVAGDYYDVMLGADGALGLALGDVSGKGVGASLLSAGLHAMVRGRLPAPACDLARLLEDLNTHLVESSAEGMFATLVVARIDPSSGRMAYANAGHPPALLMGAAGGRWLDDGGPLAGVIPRARYAPGELSLVPGDLLVIYSDGVTEAARPGGEMFGEQRLLEALRCARDLPAAEVLSRLLEAVEGFAGAEEPADDISVIVVRRLA
jgi:sigma-B regulation protein RsbU (phosphoserine phosphatase)